MTNFSVRYKRLRELCSPITGLWKGQKEPFVRVGVIRNANFTHDFQIDYLNIEILDVEEKKYKTRKLIPGDIIVEKSGGSEKNPVGRAVLFLNSEGEYSFSNFTGVLRIKDSSELDYQYLFWFLRYSYGRGDTRSMQSAATGIHNLDFDKYLDISVPVIPLLEQRKVVERIEQSFEKVQFLEMRSFASYEDAETTKFICLENAVRPQKNWTKSSLKTLCSKIGSGATPKGGKNTYISQGVSLIRSMNVHNGFFKYDNLAHIDDAAALRLKGVTVHEGDVLFNITGASIARCSVVPKNVLPARVNQHVAILRLKGEVIPEFLCYTLNSFSHQRELLQIGEAGSTRQAITKNDLENHIVAYPSIRDQRKIVEHLNAITDKIRHLQLKFEESGDSCDTLRFLILKKIFEFQ